MSTRFKLRSDLQRASINGFALPLGFSPPPNSNFQPPQQGYTVSFVPAEDDEPDTYSFHIVVSHERLAEVVHRSFDLLPQDVYAIVEIGSRDAYRSTDTFISDDPISRDDFLNVWAEYEPFFLEDSSVGVGANSEEPFVEVFLDQWKGLAIHVPTVMREEVEGILQEMGLDEVPQTWPTRQDESPIDLGLDDEGNDQSHVRSVLDLSDENAADVDELLLDLRHAWRLALNVDPESNLDEVGRELGATLWHAVVLVERVASDDGEARSEGDARSSPSSAAGGDANAGSSGSDAVEIGGSATNGPASGGAGNGGAGYASVWATANSINQMEQMIHDAMDDYPQWSIAEIFTIDRVAFDERPDELSHLKPLQALREPQVHLVTIEHWGEPAQ